MKNTVVPGISIVVDDWWEMLVIFFGAVLVIVVVSIFFRGSIPTPWGEIVLGKGRRKKAPAHSTCPHAGDIMSVIARTTELIEEKERSEISMMAEQMKFYEEVELEIKGVLQRVFVKLLDDRIGKDAELIQHPEYTTYMAVLNMVSVHMKDWFRVTMRQNHLAELDGDRWVKYKERKKAYMIQTTTDILNQFWRGKVIPRTDLYKVNMDSTVQSSVDKYINDIFDNCRRIAIDYSIKVETIRSEYEKWLKEKITG